MGKKKKNKVNDTKKTIVASNSLETSTELVSSATIIQRSLMPISLQNTQEIVLVGNLEKECQAVLKILKEFHVNLPPLSQEQIQFFKERADEIDRDIKTNPFYSKLITHKKMKPTNDSALMEILSQFCALALIASYADEFKRAEEYLQYAKEGSTFLKDEAQKENVETLVSMRTAQMKNNGSDYESCIYHANQSLEKYKKIFKKLTEDTKYKRSGLENLASQLNVLYPKIGEELEKTADQIQRYIQFDCDDIPKLEVYKIYLENLVNSNAMSGELATYLYLEGDYQAIAEEMRMDTLEADNANYGMMLIYINMASSYCYRFLQTNEKVNPLYNVQKAFCHLQDAMDLCHLKKERILSREEKFIITKMLVGLIDAICVGIEKLIKLIMEESFGLQQSKIYFNFAEQFLLAINKAAYLLHQFGDGSDIEEKLGVLREKLAHIDLLIETKMVQTLRSENQLLRSLETAPTVQAVSNMTLEVKDESSISNISQQQTENANEKITPVIVGLRDERVPEDLYLNAIKLVKQRKYEDAVCQFKELETLIADQHEYLYLKVKLYAMMGKCFGEIALKYTRKIDFYEIFKQARVIHDSEMTAINEAYDYYNRAVTFCETSFKLCGENQQYLHRHYEELWLHGQNVVDQVNTNLNAFRQGQQWYLRRMRAVKTSLMKNPKWYQKKDSDFIPSPTGPTTRWCAESYRATEIIRIHVGRLSENFRQKTTDQFSVNKHEKLTLPTKVSSGKSKTNPKKGSHKSKKEKKTVNNNNSTEETSLDAQQVLSAEMCLLPQPMYFYDQYGWLYYGTPDYPLPVIYDDIFFYNLAWGHVPIQYCPLETYETLVFFTHPQINPEGFVQRLVYPESFPPGSQGQFFSSAPEVVSLEQAVANMDISSQQGIPKSEQEMQSGASIP